ncbi:hypothetical protein [Actinoplanes solisilvae]|uniref:hypothetical protein n=1 Tax=Actinoplanes solisilvae TaxID=2486853 RepID=UPI000FDB8B06|nr:hypothetical protein [Actinoplanes solisilvae]
MGYTGTIVVGRSPGLLVHEDGIGGFGHRHRFVRPLGDGWQLVETGGWTAPPDLREPCRALATATGRPVLAAHIFDDDCGVLCATTCDFTGPSTHLNFVDTVCGYEHQPGPQPQPRELDDVIAELVNWARDAALTADQPTLRRVLTADGLADDLVFALVEALGVTAIGRTLPRALRLGEWPFKPLALLGYIAQGNAVGRLQDSEPAKPWEAPAVALDAELWASAYSPTVNIGVLARRAVEVLATYRRTRGRDAQAEADLQRVEKLLAEGRLGPESADDPARAWADQRGSRDLTR